MRLKGHTAFITGAGQGIGQACAEVFASRGADLVLLDRNSETLDTVTGRTTALGRRVTPVVVDLTDLENLKKELDRVCSGLEVDILVNNAGFDRPGTSAKLTMAGFEAVMGIHLSACTPA